MSQISHWKSEFYKNGQPKEVIVIEDTPPPDENINKLKYRIEVLPDPTEGTMTRSKRTRAGMQETAVIPASVKRRKMTINNNNNITAPNIPTTTTTTTTTTSIPQANLIRPILHKPIPTKAPPITQACDDKDGHYIIKPNESLTPRYKIMKLLGQGTFGKVVECYDRVKRNFCAIKIIRAIPKYRDASKIEIRVLNSLKEHDPINLNKCIHLMEWFDYHNHICMVFELLGQSVFDFLKLNDFRPFPIHHIQQFAKQLLTSVAYLKPENILLVNSDYTEAGNMAGMDPKSKILLNTDIRLIDFGSATFEQDYHSTVVSTRHYRAPEIILGMGWSYPCDIWSIGCILVEFLTGDALFQTHDNLEHLAMMEVVLGKIPPELVKLSSPEAQKYFDNSKLKYPNANTTKQSKKYVRALKLLQDIVCPSTQPTSNAKAQFLDLLSRMLIYDPNQRTSAREALRHPFFMIQFDEWGRELA
ncbi:Putative CMGC/CLK protein kinase [Rhizopus microsporus]|nr:Putative CMGC/CLK protein kinase [Rhizopus microsporus]